MISCEFCKTSKNIFFTEHLRTTTSLLGFVVPMHEGINESSPSLILRLFLWCEIAVFLLPIGYMTQIMPRREKRLKKASKGCHSMTQLFSLYQNNPESSASVVTPVNEPTPENQHNEPETPQSESTISIDSDNAPMQTFGTKRQIESHETDVIQPKVHPPKTYVFTKTKIGSRERLFRAHWREDCP